METVPARQVPKIRSENPQLWSGPFFGANMMHTRNIMPTSPAGRNWPKACPHDDQRSWRKSWSVGLPPRLTNQQEANHFKLVRQCMCVCVCLRVSLLLVASRCSRLFHSSPSTKHNHVNRNCLWLTVLMVGSSRPRSSCICAFSSDRASRLSPLLGSFSSSRGSTQPQWLMTTVDRGS